MSTHLIVTLGSDHAEIAHPELPAPIPNVWLQRLLLGETEHMAILGPTATITLARLITGRDHATNRHETYRSLADLFGPMGLKDRMAAKAFTRLYRFEYLELLEPGDTSHRLWRVGLNAKAYH